MSFPAAPAYQHCRIPRLRLVMIVTTLVVADTTKTTTVKADRGDGNGCYQVGRAFGKGAYRTTVKVALSLQEDLHKISVWSDRWEMPFNVDKRQDLQVETRNKKFDYAMRGVKLKSVECVKDLGVKIESNLKFSQQCVDAANKANRMLCFNKRNFLFKNKDVIPPLYTSLVRPHLEYAVQFWSPHQFFFFFFYA